jgi:hypothetical protein
MSVSELRSQIINTVSLIEDESVLTEIYNLIKIETDTIYQLSASEKHAVEVGLRDIQNGNVFSSDKANDKRMNSRYL